MIKDYNILIESLNQSKAECNIPIFMLHYLIISNGYLKIFRLFEKRISSNKEILQHINNVLQNTSNNTIIISTLSKKYNLEYWVDFLNQSNIAFNIDYNENNMARLFY